MSGSPCLGFASAPTLSRMPGTLQSPVREEDVCHSSWWSPSLAHSGYTLVRDKIVKGNFKFLEFNNNSKIVCNKIYKVDFIGKYIAL